MELQSYLFCLSISLFFFVFYVFSDLLSKTMGCLSGCLMSSASIQKLFCGIWSVFKCSYNEFVGEKVVSPSYSSTILGPSLFSPLFAWAISSFPWLNLMLSQNNYHLAYSLAHVLVFPFHCIIPPAKQQAKWSPQLPRWLSGKGSPCPAGDAGSIPRSGRFPWKRKWQPTPVFLPGKSHGQRRLEGYSPWVANSQTWCSE